MKLILRLYFFIFIITSNLACIGDGEGISGNSVDDYLGQEILKDENKQLLAYNVPTFPMPVTEQQITTDDWTNFRASTPISGFYRQGSDQIERSAFDLYLPQNKENGTILHKQPLIIFIHCGAFITGKKDDDLIISSLCRDFTRKGFATASINYRLLVNTSNIFTKILSFGAAVLSKENRNSNLYHNSICDIRRSVQYFRLNANKYDIDPDNIFLFGYSAGAIAALHSIYLDDSRASIWIHGMEGYNKSEFDIQKPKIRGVVSVSGGFFKPPNEMWEDNENTPLLLIQGDKDEMVPYGEGLPFQRYVKDYRINSLPIGEVKKEETDNEGYEKQTTYTARLGVQVDASWVDFLRKSFTDNMYGSGIIKDNKKSNCTLVTVTDGLHYFPVDPNTGGFNESYFTMREHALKFINQNIKANNGL